MTGVASFEFVAGRLLCSEVRDFLKSLKFKGYDIDYLESSGLLSRTFTIKGEKEAVEIAHRSLQKWSDE